MGSKKRKIQPGELGAYNMQLAADIKHIGAAVLATDIARWCEFNRATHQTEYTYLSLDYICDNLHPEMTKSQVRTCIKHLVDNQIVDVIKGEGRNEKGQLMADSYRLSAKGKKYFPEFSDTRNISEDQEEEIEGVSPEVYQRIKEKLYADIRKDVEAEFRIEERRKVKHRKKTVNYTEKEERFFQIFVANWNEDIPQSPICRVTAQLKAKLKKMITLYDGIGITEIVQLSMYITESDFLMGKPNKNGQTFDGFSWSWMTKDDFVNLDKIISGNYHNKKSFTQWLKDGAN